MSPAHLCMDRESPERQEHFAAEAESEIVGQVCRQWAGEKGSAKSGDAD